MAQLSFKNLLLSFALLTISVLGAIYFLHTKAEHRQIACTQEAKQCPDGSYVARTGPNCEFAQCPSPPTPTANSQETDEIKIGQVAINLDQIKELQQAVDQGHQPWRLVPDEVIMAEIQQYGFSIDDLKTIKKDSGVSGIVTYKIIHKGVDYTVTVFQPIQGEPKIWTISNIVRLEPK